MSQSSYRTILRSSSIIGGAQLVSVAAGIAKMKAVAILLGPAGVGLYGLYLGLIQTASTIASMGIGNAGTRQIAAAFSEGGDEGVERARDSLVLGATLLALLGAIIFWVASGWIADVVFEDQRRSTDIAWLSLGVALTVIAGSQAALLTGLRRVGDLARINISASIIGGGAGVLAVFFLGAEGLVAMILVVPAVTFLISHVYVSRVGPIWVSRISMRQLWHEWRGMITLGFAFMLSFLASTLGHLVARTVVQRELGAEALGHFQAAWSIGMTYLGFVLVAMGTDYFPRLTAVINDRTTAGRVVNEQTEIMLMLCAPVLLAMQGLAPWVIRSLYSVEFESATEILRWQLLGDILKVMSWPLGYLIMASGAGKTFVLTESLGMGVFVVSVAIGLPMIGINATGVGFLVMYAVYLPMVRWFCGRSVGFYWSVAVKKQAGRVIAAMLLVFTAANWSEQVGAVLGVGLAGAYGLWAFTRLISILEVRGRLECIAGFGEKVRRWMIGG